MKCRVLSVILLLVALVWPCAFAEGGFSSNPDAIEKAAQSVLMLEVFDADDNLIGTGSGFVAFNNRTIVTNYHVIDGADWVRANSDLGYQYMVTKVLVADEEKDIAICSFMSPTDLMPLELNTDGQQKRAESIVAIGSPIGITNTVSLGNISALYKDTGVSWIQFTAPISSGSSGGALFDDNGKVIGVTSASYIDTQNLNLAIHASEVELLYQDWDGRELPFEEYLAMISVTLSPEPTSTPAPTPAPTATPVPIAIPNANNYELLLEGATGEVVRRLQQALIDLGYLEGEADGILGPKTSEAIELFNEQNGLMAVGVALEETQQLLFDGQPRRYQEPEVTLKFIDGAKIETVRLDGNVLKMRFQVTNLGKKKVIKTFELCVYARDARGRKVFDDQKYYQTTQRMVNPGDSCISNYFTLPNGDSIYTVFCGISKIEYNDGTIVSIPKIDFARWIVG